MKILKAVKDSPFKPLVRKTYLGRIIHGTPYFDPQGFNSSIISFRKLKLTPQEEIDKLSNDWQRKAKRFKNLPMARRCKDWTFKLFGNWYWLSIGWPIAYKEVELGWKDKWNSPRYEWGPYKVWNFFKWQYCIFYQPPTKNVDKYWEMYLWWRYYTEDRDIIKAKETWGWVNAETKVSTWDESFLEKSS